MAVGLSHELPVEEEVALDDLADVVLGQVEEDAVDVEVVLDRDPVEPHPEVAGQGLGLFAGSENTQYTFSTIR